MCYWCQCENDALQAFTLFVLHTRLDKNNVQLLQNKIWKTSILAEEIYNLCGIVSSCIIACILFKAIRGGSHLREVTFQKVEEKCCPTVYVAVFWSRSVHSLDVVGRKKKEQHDANQAGMGLNPAFAGAYGATAVSISI